MSIGCTRFGRKGCNVSSYEVCYFYAEVGADRYQPPLMRKLTKSAKARAKKRERQSKAADVVDVDAPAQSELKPAT